MAEEKSAKEVIDAGPTLATTFDQIRPGREKVVVLRKVKPPEVCWYKPWTWFRTPETVYTVGPAKWENGSIDQKGYVFRDKETAYKAKKEMEQRLAEQEEGWLP